MYLTQERLAVRTSGDGDARFLAGSADDDGVDGGQKLRVQVAGGSGGGGARCRLFRRRRCFVHFAARGKVFHAD